MNNPDFIPRQDAHFSLWLENLINCIEENIIHWGIPPDAFDVLKIKAAEFQTAFQVYATRDSRSPYNTFVKNSTRKEVSLTARLLIKSAVNFNPLITDVDRIKMGLPVYKTTRSKVTIPTAFPVYTIGVKMARSLILHFYDRVSGKRAKPDGVSGCEIRWTLSEDVPQSQDEFIYSDFATRSPYRLLFSEDQRSRKIWFRLCWQNTKGEKGPWSDQKSAIIP